MVTITGYSTREGVGGKQSLFLHVESDLIPKSSKTRTGFMTTDNAPVSSSLLIEEIREEFLTEILSENST